MLKNILLFFIGLSLCIMTSIHAAQVTGDTLTRVNIEQVNKIAGKLIAPCCWKQTVDVHPSSASDKIKAEIEKALLEGQTEEQIIDRFVAEYGERIRAIPKPEGINLFLWILPAAVLLVGGLIIALYLRYVTRHKNDIKAVPQTPMNESELKRVEKELKELDS
jgi:cytochrome c-type biogenesis protein CcmH